MRLRLAQIDEREGRRNKAAGLYAEILRSNPNLIEAWWGLSQTVRDPDRVLYCLRRVLAINPYHSEVGRRLKQQALKLISDGLKPVNSFAAVAARLAASLDKPLYN